MPYRARKIISPGERPGLKRELKVKGGGDSSSARFLSLFD
jgi:hypothetical protein